jgi:hypothetical protein
MQDEQITLGGFQVLKPLGWSSIQITHVAPIRLKTWQDKSMEGRL